MRDYHYFTDGVGYWVSVGLPEYALPEGTTEVPPKTSADHEWDGSQWVHTPPDPTVVLAAIRAEAFMPKLAFLNEVAERGILTDEDAIAAAKGEWPSAMADFLDMLTPAQKRDAQIAWAASSQVDRMDVFMLTLASWLGIPDETVDAIFGIAP